MSVLTFKGGIHPFDGKEMTKTKSVIEYMPVGEVIIPVSQHIGAPAEIIVNAGDKVLQGQLIAKASGFVSANVHSSISGQVKEIRSVMLAGGNMSQAVVIENDYNYEAVSTSDFRTPESMSREEKIELIRAAGVVGMGGACFPTHVKLSPKNPEAIEYVIVNGAECEPYLTSDYRVMIDMPERVISGLREVLSLFDNAKGIIAVEDNKLDAIAKLKSLLKDDRQIEVKEVYTKYPQGGERALICAITGRKVNSDMLPSDVGCIVNNIDTICAIYSAIYEKKPLISRIVTVTGSGIKKPQNYKVLIGTSIDEIIADVGGLHRKTKKIISGGPMMGTALMATNIPVVKGTSAILCLREDEARAVESNCISCARCVSVCPGRIVPSLVAKAARNNDAETFQKYNGMECCECGCCSYICPAKRNLTQSIKKMRKEILASRKR